MASFSVDGIISGLDTTSLINALLSTEAAPQRLLSAKRTHAESQVTAWQSLNTKIAALATQARGLAADDGLAPRAVTSSHGSVTASAKAGAAAGELTFTVASTARSQSSVTAAMTRPRTRSTSLACR